MRPLAHRLSRFAKSVPLHGILVAPFVLQISLAVGLIGWLSIRNGQQAVNEVAVQLRNELTSRIEQYLQTYLSTPHRINQLNAKAVQLGEVNLQDFASLEHHLWYQLKIFDTVTAVYIGSENREHVAVEREEDGQFQVKVSGDSTNHEVRIYAADRPGNRIRLLRSRPNYDPRTRPWYTSAVKAGTAQWGGVYRLFATPKYVLNASLPIYGDRNQLLGVAAVDFSLTGISQFLHGLKIGKSGETFILESETGLLVGSSATQEPYMIENPDAPITKQNPVRVKAIDSSDVLTRRTVQYLLNRFGSLSQIQAREQLNFEIEGQRQFLQVVPLKNSQGLDWVIVVVVPEADFMDQIQANTRTTILLCLAALGLAIVLGVFTTRWITQPILHLGNAAKAIAAGNLDQTVVVNSTKELNGLAQSFNQMAQQLRELFSSLEQTNENLEIRVQQRTTELGEKNAQLQQEIRDRQKVEAALKTSEVELRLMFAAMTDTVIVFDAEGRYLRCMQTQSSHKPDIDLVGKTVHEVLPQGVADLFTEAIQQALYLRNHESDDSDARKNVFVEYLLPVKKHRETWFLASVTPLSDHTALWVARDITKLKKIQAELKQAKETADAANLAKSQFLSNMSHELRTPLNIILGFTQLMLSNRSLESQQQDYLDTINRSGEDLLTLINDVLEMSKIEAGRVTLNETSFDLYSLLDRLQQMFYLKARFKGLQLVFERSPTVPQYICTDQTKLRQVLVNLIGNAIKFTKAGQITLRVKPANQESSAGFLLLEFNVVDTGCGIAATDLDRLFEPFVQTDAGQKAQEGTGLGLPISQRFVQLMGGTITVESTLNEGSTFTFQIRTCAAVPDQIPPPASPSRQVIGLEPEQPTYRILIAEDKLENRRLLMELLTPVGFEVREAINGQAAIELWQTWKPHLILMDIRMPVMNGFEATQQIKAAGNQTPVIIALTGSPFEEDRVMALSVGCDDFVRKPFRIQLIFEKIAEYLGVRYRYADLPELQTINQGTLHPSDLPASLTVADLSVMSLDWLQQLHQASLRVNANQILKLIEQIPQVENHLIQTLTALVDQCCFQEIVAVAQESVLQGSQSITR
jgi:signal transduction histidine kinase/CheY-like chemotaxis protein